MKRFLAIFVAALLLFSLASCSSEKNETAQDSTKAASTEETRKLVVGFDAEFPPFGFVAEDGSYDGFDLALAKEACSRLGWEFEAVPIDWDAKDSELASGNIDCIWNGFTINGREEQYTWSDAYVDNTIVIVVKADSGIKTMADLAGKKVMVQKASSAADGVDSNKEFKDSLDEVIQLADYNTGFMELNTGTVSACIADMGIAKYQVEANGGDYVILDETVSSEQYGIGFLLGNTELRDIINTKLHEMADDGTMMNIANNYVDKGLVTESLCLCK
ncbi:MAG: amino acid ABC transporter substrate-binding protein [Clostridiales bacterium]|nr:amino acid ABC transporter substrate-binding protein [Clostridiales bacterium]